MRSITRGLLALALLMGPAIGTAQAITLKEIIQYQEPRPFDSDLADRGGRLHLPPHGRGRAEPQGSRRAGAGDPRDDRHREAEVAAKDRRRARTARRARAAGRARDAAPRRRHDVHGRRSTRARRGQRQPACLAAGRRVARDGRSAGADCRAGDRARPPSAPAAAADAEPAVRGYGGQKRPDSWGPTPAPSKPASSDQKADPTKKGGSSGSGGGN